MQCGEPAQRRSHRRRPGRSAGEVGAGVADRRAAARQGSGSGNAPAVLLNNPVRRRKVRRWLVVLALLDKPGGLSSGANGNVATVVKDRQRRGCEGWHHRARRKGLRSACASSRASCTSAAPGPGRPRHARGAVIAPDRRPPVAGRRYASRRTIAPARRFSQGIRPAGYHRACAGDGASSPASTRCPAFARSKVRSRCASASVRWQSRTLAVHVHRPGVGGV